jgi:hypothetical protein
MTLFFYGALASGEDRAKTVQLLREVAHGLAWNLRIDEPRSPASRLVDHGVAFELANADNKDVYEQLYDDFAGQVMVQAYRDAGRRVGVNGWETLEFGASEVVDAAYREQPAELPVIRFIREVVGQAADRLCIFCFDDGNEGPAKLKRRAGNAQALEVEAWMTVAFGYTWPNVCLAYDPRGQLNRIALKLMADYETFPLWLKLPDGTSNMDPQRLPLSADTRARLASWAAAYDATLNRADPLASGFESAEAEAEFDRAGLELRRTVQDELGDAYTVTYYSYTRHQELCQP